MKPSCIFRLGWLVTLLLMVTSLAAPISAQGPDFETFDDPALPGWERSPGAAVVDGALRLDPGNFLFHGGEWGDLTLTVRTRRFGEALAVSFRASDPGLIPSFLAATFWPQQPEAGGAVAELGAAAPISLPTGECLWRNSAGFSSA